MRSERNKIATKSGPRGEVVHIDQVGICITNLPAGRVFKNGTTRVPIRDCYAAAKKGKPFAVTGFTDRLKIAIHTGHAAKLLRIKLGAKVLLAAAATPLNRAASTRVWNATFPGRSDTGTVRAINSLGRSGPNRSCVRPSQAQFSKVRRCPPVYAKWEYKSVQLYFVPGISANWKWKEDGRQLSGTPDMVAMTRELGLQGWELISAPPLGPAAEGCYWFKRPLPGGTPPPLPGG